MSGIRNPGLLSWLHLMRVFQKMQHHSMSHLQEYKVTSSQFEVLSRLSVTPGITQQELAEKLLVTKGNVCGLIDRLEDQDLVERRPDPDDRRSYMLYLTSKGQKLASEVIPAHEEFISEHMSALSDEEQTQLHALLRNLDNSLKRHRH